MELHARVIHPGLFGDMLYACGVCGGAVADLEGHRLWHEALEQRIMAAALAATEARLASQARPIGDVGR